MKLLVFREIYKKLEGNKQRAVSESNRGTL
jgi:hypothetical protein